MTALLEWSTPGFSLHWPWSASRVLIMFGSLTLLLILSTVTLLVHLASTEMSGMTSNWGPHDYWTSCIMTGPVSCTDEEDYCYSDSYVALGNWLSSETTGVPKGTQRQCTGLNSFARDRNEWSYRWRECQPIDRGLCPGACVSVEVSGPAVEDYVPNGAWIGFSDPSTACATILDSCPCGKEAKVCPGSAMRCIFKDEDCPVNCGVFRKFSLSGLAGTVMPGLPWLPARGTSSPHGRTNFATCELSVRQL